MCECYNQIGEGPAKWASARVCTTIWGRLVETRTGSRQLHGDDRSEALLVLPDTAHLYLAGIDPPKSIGQHKGRLMLLDYKDARHVGERSCRTTSSSWATARSTFRPGRILKSIAYKGWICVDLDTARKGPRASYERCGAYVVDKLEPIYV